MVWGRFDSMGGPWTQHRKDFIGDRKRPPVLLFILALFLFFIPFSVRKASASETTGGEAAFHSFKIKDATGREITFDRLPRRIVVMGRGPFMALDLLYMFPEARDRLVGYEVKYNIKNDFLPLVDPGFQRKATMGTNPGPEQVAALQPDLVIMKGTIPMQIGESLRVLDIPVVYLGLESPDLFFKDVENLGLLFGDPARARVIDDYYRHFLEHIASGLKGIKEEEKPRVLVLEYSDRGGKVAVQVPARSWIQTIQAVIAGGRPVWLQSAHPTDGWTLTNFEQIAAWDPDKIFAMIWFALDPDKVIESLRSDPGWRMLRAVRNHGLYAFPTDIFGWSSPEPRWILGIQWLAKKMHPARFPDIDIRTEVYRYFTEMYFLERGVVTSEIIPSIYLGSE